MAGSVRQRGKQSWEVRAFAGKDAETGKQRVGMLEVAGGEVAARDGNESLLLEHDIDLPALVVDGDDAAHAAVLHEVVPADSVEAAVVPSGDDFIADEELAAVGDDEEPLTRGVPRPHERGRMGLMSLMTNDGHAAS